MKNEKIIKYAATGLLLLATGLILHDETIDHTNNICPITKIMNGFPNIKDINTPAGIALHQIPEMKRNYAEKGINDVTISYETLTEKKIETIYVAPTLKISYAVPAGYTLVNNGNGEVYGEKKYTEIVNPTSIESEDGKISYVAPSGFTLVKNGDGNYYCIRNVTETVEASEKVDYLAPSGYTMITDENGEKSCVINRVVSTELGMGLKSTFSNGEEEQLTLKK